jgi:hypothetical protein
MIRTWSWTCPRPRVLHEAGGLLGVERLAGVARARLPRSRSPKPKEQQGRADRDPGHHDRHQQPTKAIHSASVGRNDTVEQPPASGRGNKPPRKASPRRCLVRGHLKPARNLLQPPVGARVAGAVALHVIAPTAPYTTHSRISLPSALLARPEPAPPPVCESCPPSALANGVLAFIGNPVRAVRSHARIGGA